MDRVLKMMGAALGVALALTATESQAGASKEGASVFHAQCAVCHSDTARGGTMIGPRLFGVVGRKAGAQPGYSYSAAMRASGITWTPGQLEAYVANPAKVVHGNKMPFAGLHNPAQVESLIEYLKTLK